MMGLLQNILISPSDALTRTYTKICSYVVEYVLFVCAQMTYLPVECGYALCSFACILLLSLFSKIFGRITQIEHFCTKIYILR